MNNIKTNSLLGGVEIIQINYPEFYGGIKTLINNSSQESITNAIEFFFKSDLITKNLSGISEISHISENNLLIPKMRNIPVYMIDEIAIYFPKSKISNFWFDLVALDFFFGNNLFKTCIILLTSEILKELNMQYEQLINLFNDSSICIVKFPIYVIYENIDQGDIP